MHLLLPWHLLAQPDGWEPVITRSTPAGPVHVERRTIDGSWCLRATGHSSATPQRLLDVAWDIPDVPRWSSNPLLVSEVLSAGQDHQVFWQHLDVPTWTLVHDRYWVLEAHALRHGEVRGYRWARVEADTAWPEVVARARAVDAGALQPPVMWGEWIFEPEGEASRVTWRGCSDIGGRIPSWLQVWASARSLPDALLDLVREAER